MSKTYKDKPVKYGGRFKRIDRKNAKEEARGKRHLLKRLIVSPPLGYIKKILSDIWNWD